MVRSGEVWIEETTPDRSSVPVKTSKKRVNEGRAQQQSSPSSWRLRWGEHRSSYSQFFAHTNILGEGSEHSQTVEGGGLGAMKAPELKNTDVRTDDEDTSWGLAGEVKSSKFFVIVSNLLPFQENRDFCFRWKEQQGYLTEYLGNSGWLT